MIGGLPFAPKPRIVVWTKAKSGRYVWQCVGAAGRYGLGMTPADAYTDWRSQFERVW